jgi:hypothetical protein
MTQRSRSSDLPFDADCLSEHRRAFLRRAASAALGTVGSRNGKKGPEYDEIVQNGPVFRQDGTLEYLAIQDGALYRVRHRP